jgi:hypothetical protein
MPFAVPRQRVIFLAHGDQLYRAYLKNTSIIRMPPMFALGQ